MAILNLMVVAWRRPELLRRTLESFFKHNEREVCSRWFAVDGGYDPGVRDVLAEFNFLHGYCGEQNEGIARTFDRGLALMSEHKGTAEWVLTLEEDWECQRPLPLGALMPLMRDGTVNVAWLFGTMKERLPDGRRALPVEERHKYLPGRPAIQWEERMRDGERIRVGNGYWCHPPCITTVGLAREFTAGAKKEPESMVRSARAGVRVAWFAEPCFYHVGYVGRRQMGGKR